MKNTGPTYTDNSLLTIIFHKLNALLLDAGMTVDLLQSQQPTQQGAVSGEHSAAPGGPAIYLYKLFDLPQGHPIVQWDGTVAPVREYHAQIYFTTFQFTALVRQDPEDLDRPTSSDLANIACNLMKTRKFISDLQKLNIGIHRVTEVRNPPFEDDQDRFAFSANFDMVFTYLRELPVQKVPAAKFGQLIITNEGPAF